jgi:hypothetical protein
VAAPGAVEALGAIGGALLAMALMMRRRRHQPSPAPAVA